MDWIEWNWDHDACVNHPVSGDVWEDVLREVARWHLRVDLKAPRMERVCKRWRHFWQVAEGVFDVDVVRNRLSGMTIYQQPHNLETRMTMKNVKMWRERQRQLHLVARFQTGALHTGQPLPLYTEPLENFLARRPHKRMYRI